MKLKINWKVFLVFFIVCGGLLYLTRSFLMTLGILLLLLVADGLLKNVDEKRKRKQLNQQIIDHLHEDNSDEEGPKGGETA